MCRTEGGRDGPSDSGDDGTCGGSGGTSHTRCGQVGASHVGCGDTLTADTWLDEDLDCSASGTDGLIIGADNITLDLHGFELKGQFGTRDGIVNEGYDRVKIRNGTVTTWDAAVLLRDTRRNHIIGLTITSSDQGLVMLGGDRNLVKRNDSNAHGGQGFDIDDVTRSRSPLQHDLGQLQRLRDQQLHTEHLRQELGWTAPRTPVSRS